MGEALDLDGLVVTASYDDGSTETIPNDVITVTGFDSTVPVAGEAVTVRYGAFTASFTVDINLVPVTGVCLNHSSLGIIVGESVQLTAAVYPCRCGQ